MLETGLATPPSSVAHPLGRCPLPLSVREDYMEELCILQDDVPPFPDTEAFAIMEEQLGRPLGEVFSSISEVT